MFSQYTVYFPGNSLFIFDESEKKDNKEIENESISSKDKDITRNSITNYVYELASLFHTYYEKCHIITDNEVFGDDYWCGC